MPTVCLLLGVLRSETRLVQLDLNFHALVVL